MKSAVPLRLLLPHALSALCFGAAFAWMSHAGSNRTDPDFYLAVTGYFLLAVALVATLVAVVFVFRAGVRRHWPWLSIHLAALCGLFLVAGNWLGAHIA